MLAALENLSHSPDLSLRQIWGQFADICRVWTAKSFDSIGNEQTGF
jgi:hypothetical protein